MQGTKKKVEAAIQKDSRMTKVLHGLFAAGWPAPIFRLLPQALTAMLGMAGPIAVGAMTGHTRVGMAAALGGLALSRDEKGRTFREKAPGMVYSLVAGTAAMFAGAALGSATEGTLTAAFTIPVVAGALAIFGGVNRGLARATTLFMLFFIIAVHLGSADAEPTSIALLFFAGGLWTAILSLALKSMSLAFQPGLPDSGKQAALPRYPARQLLRRWRRSLGHMTGWQYALRITICLAAARVLEQVWPLGHGYWLSLTVVIVVHRRLDAALARNLHRAAGTLLGVLLASLLLLGHMPPWVMIAAIAILAAARPIFLEGNYTAYATVQTPLIILLLDFGRIPSMAAGVDRLACTLAGCGIALTLGYLSWRRLPMAGTPAPAGHTRTGLEAHPVRVQQHKKGETP